MQPRTKKVLTFTAIALMLCGVIEILRSPQADTRRIAREERERFRTWNGIGNYHANSSLVTRSRP